MKQLDILRSYHIPVSSAVKAIQHLSDRHSLSPKEYADRIRELVENPDVKVDDKYARHVYLYLVQETIRTSFNTDTLNMTEILSMAVEKAIKFVDDNPYVLAGSTAEPKLDENGNAKPRKGAKKEMAIALYAKMVEENNGKFPSRSDAIKRFMDEVGMTKGGASTYVANCKKNFGKSW